MRRALEVIGWIVGGVLSAILAVYLVAVAINWHDREPSATAVRFAQLYRDRPAVSNDDNAFVYVLGFDVAPDGDPAAMGLRRYTWMQGSTDVAPKDPGQDPLARAFDFDAQRSPAVLEFLSVCRTSSKGCPAAFDAGAAVFDDWIASEGWLLARYQALIAHSGWRELPMSLETPFPSYASTLDAQKLLLFQAMSLAAKHDTAGTRDLLESDLRFWRMVLSSSDSLISKMIATAAIKRHFQSGNLILRKLTPGEAGNAIPAQWRSALSEDERSLQRSLISEWVFTSAMLRDVGNRGPMTRQESFGTQALAVAMTPLFKQQDTMNENAEHYALVVKTLDVPLNRYAVAASRSEELARRVQAKGFPPTSIYNVTGRLLVSMGVGGFASYARRVGDIEGVRRATLAAVTLRAANVKAADVSAALSATDLRNPYDDHPFAWDARDKAIVFRGLETGERGLYRISY